jgi:hypothetical protein
VTSEGERLGIASLTGTYPDLGGTSNYNPSYLALLLTDLDSFSSTCGLRAIDQRPQRQESSYRVPS